MSLLNKIGWRGSRKRQELIKKPTVEHVILDKEIYEILLTHVIKTKQTGLEYGFKCEFELKSKELIIKQIHETSSIKKLNLIFMGDNYSKLESSLILGDRDLHTHPSTFFTVKYCNPLGFGIEKVKKQLKDFARLEYQRQGKFSKQDLAYAKNRAFFGVINYINPKEISMQCLWRGKPVPCYVSENGTLTQILDKPTKDLELGVLGQSHTKAVKDEHGMCIKAGTGSVIFTTTVNKQVTLIDNYLLQTIRTLNA
jgi:hypothetical protein